MGTFHEVLMTEYGGCPPDCNACGEACLKRMDGRTAGIQPVHLPEVDFHGVVRCNQCTTPACAQGCPTKAISRIDGVVRIDRERCVGCGLCTLTCSYAGIFQDAETKKAYSCDMCDQSPECIEACRHGLLSLGGTQHIREHLGEDILSPGVPLCQGCTEELAVRLAMRVFGRKTFVFTGPGCVAPAISSIYSGAFLRAPTFVGRMTNMPAIMTGVKRHYRNIGKNVRCVGFCRRRHDVRRWFPVPVRQRRTG